MFQKFMSSIDVCSLYTNAFLEQNIEIVCHHVNEIRFPSYAFCTNDVQFLSDGKL